MSFVAIIFIASFPAFRRDAGPFCSQNWQNAPHEMTREQLHGVRWVDVRWHEFGWSTRTRMSLRCHTLCLHASTLLCSLLVDNSTGINLHEPYQILSTCLTIWCCMVMATMCSFASSTPIYKQSNLQKTIHNKSNMVSQFYVLVFSCRSPRRKHRLCSSGCWCLLTWSPKTFWAQPIPCMPLRT